MAEVKRRGKPGAGRRRIAPPLFLLTLSACRSVDPGLGVPAAATPPAAPAISSPEAAAGPIQFLPVVGIPADKAVLLSRALAVSAEKAGVAIRPSDAGAAPLRLKGYLSAVRESADTLVVFVWDVVDPSGGRVSRIQDQIRLSGTGADAWSVVDAAALSQIADMTIAALRPPVAGN